MEGLIQDCLLGGGGLGRGDGQKFSLVLTVINTSVFLVEYR